MKRKRRELTELENHALERLKKLWSIKKKELSLTQESVGLACGWSGQTAFSQYLNGYVPLNIESVMRISNVLKVNPVEIMPEISPLLPTNSNDDTGHGEYENLTNEEKVFLQLLRGLTSEQKKDTIKDIEAIKRQNEVVIKELTGKAA